ncbi:hypothetical protein [Streptomyces sp. V1I1]|nr:hypothetical protein [Streptomyces sp. V1I1]MDQ0938833.1 hypothetical protein [Streptomyces sp. V1I1]
MTDHHIGRIVPSSNMAMETELPHGAVPPLCGRGLNGGSDGVTSSH